MEHLNNGPIEDQPIFAVVLFPMLKCTTEKGPESVSHIERLCPLLKCVHSWRLYFSEKVDWPRFPALCYILCSHNMMLKLIEHMYILLTYHNDQYLQTGYKLSLTNLHNCCYCTLVVVARWMSAPAWTSRSTISVWPLWLATYSGLKPRCKEICIRVL